MLVAASVTVVLLAGLKVGADTPVESIVKVMLAALPWLPCTSW